jgi:O-antigen/teichoic acid export membrane protein
MSATQIVIGGVVLFLLYRFLLYTIGPRQLGIWSLVSATISVIQIANLGLSSSVIKYVAKYKALGDFKKLSEVIQTAVITVTVLVGFLLVICYPLFKLILQMVIPAEVFYLALSILPYALFSLLLMMITSIFQSGLYGINRIDLSSYPLMGKVIVNLVLCIILTPIYGLLGMAYASVIQNLLTLVTSLVLLKKQLPFLPVILFRWSKSTFKKIFFYGINSQVISIAVMLCDPVTKVLLSTFGSLSMVGFYEMASRMVQQFRAVIVSASQVIVPTIADMNESAPEKIRSLYLHSYGLLFYLALPLLSLIIVCAPIISEIWIGYYEQVFVYSTTLLAIGWFLNTLAVPAYFTNSGMGELRWNVIGQSLIAIVNGVLGLVLGYFYNGFGVIAAWIIALPLGNSLIYVFYHIKHRIPFSELIPKSSKALLFTCLLGIIAAFTIKVGFDHTTIAKTLNILVAVVFAAVVFIPFWFHPLRKSLIRWACDAFQYR